MTKPRAIIVDLDGVLCDHRHRLHFVEIPGFPKYKAADDGHIYSFMKKEPKKLKAFSSKRGYLYLSLWRDGKGVRKSVHELILIAFHGIKPECLESSHLNNVKSDNRPENLKWETRAENLARRPRSDGIYNAFSKFTIEQVHQIRKLYASGKSLCSIAREFNSHHSTVGEIARRISYANF